MKRHNQGRYNGVYMSATFSILPGLSSLSRLTDLSPEAKKKLKWMDYYHKCHNVSKTCRYFGIPRKTFYYWRKRYNPHYLASLEEHSRRPKNTRQWMVSRAQEFRILELRKKYIRYGKEKLKRIYEDLHNEPISSWKIQRTIEKHNLYYNPSKTEKLRKKRKHNQVKKRITELQKEKRTGFLVAFDGLTIYWNSIKRYILTAIDIHFKIAFAKMYKTKNSKNAADFLERIHYLLEGKVENIQTDNGSEFARYFDLGCQKLNLNRYFSRPKTPQDNSFDERFNRTLKEEFIQLGNLTYDCNIFNRKLTEWLIEYNFRRPHQSLGYLPPINFHYKYHKVLPMYPSSTKT